MQSTLETTTGVPQQVAVLCDPWKWNMQTLMEHTLHPFPAPCRALRAAQSPAHASSQPTQSRHVSRGLPADGCGCVTGLALGLSFHAPA